MEDKNVAGQIRELRQSLVALQQRLNELEAALRRDASPQAPAAPAAAPVPKRTTPPPLPSPAAWPEYHRPQPAEPRVPLKPAEPRPALEQFLGMKALLVVGVAVLLLGGAFFFKYAVEQGWITPLRRTIMGALWGLVMIGLGEWAFRRNMRYFAAGLFGAGVVWWYYTVFNASPNGFFAHARILNTQSAFVLMCGTTAAGVGLAARSGFRVSGIIALVGAIVTPVLLSTGENRLVLLMSYLLAVNVGFLALAAVKRWGELAPIALAGTIGLFAAWFDRHYSLPQWPAVAAFAWTHFAIFYVYAGLAGQFGRTHDFFGIALLGAAGAALAVLGLAAEPGDTALFGHLLTLELAVLAICFWRRWCSLRLGMLLWTAGVLLLRYGMSSSDIATEPIATLWAGWIWVLYAPILLDVLVRALRPWTQKDESRDAILAALASGAMFAATYGLLREDYQPWMGLYATALGAAAVAGAILLWRVANRPLLGYSFLAVALVLLALAVPIQFDRAPVTLAWAIQGVVAMFLYRRLGKTLLLGAALAVLALAIWHYFAVETRHDPRMAETLLSVAGVVVPNLLALAITLSTALLGSAALLRYKRDPSKARGVEPLVHTLCIAGTGLYLYQTAVSLPVLAATWWWLVPAAAAWLLALWGRARLAAAFALSALGAAACKWVLYDTLHWYVTSDNETSRRVVLNWQFAAGAALAAVLIASARPMVRRLVSFPRQLAGVCGIVGALLVVWGGSFEVHRYFSLPAAAQRFADPALAFQMGLSIWWALCAGAILVVGFAGDSVPARYLAMAVFGITLAKVFFVDMEAVQAVYRILSFMALGTLMVVGSWLYHRHFRAPARQPKPPESN